MSRPPRRRRRTSPPAPGPRGAPPPPASARSRATSQLDPRAAGFRRFIRFALTVMSRNTLIDLHDGAACIGDWDARQGPTTAIAFPCWIGTGSRSSPQVGRRDSRAGRFSAANGRPSSSRSSKRATICPSTRRGSARRCGADHGAAPALAKITSLLRFWSVMPSSMPANTAGNRRCSSSVCWRRVSRRRVAASPASRRRRRTPAMRL